MSKKRKRCSGNKWVTTPKGDVPIGAMMGDPHYYAKKYREAVKSLPLYAKRIRIEKTKALLQQKTYSL